jgi:hypothetical protein
LMGNRCDGLKLCPTRDFNIRQHNDLRCIGKTAPVRILRRSKARPYNNDDVLASMLLSCG